MSQKLGLQPTEVTCGCNAGPYSSPSEAITFMAVMLCSECRGREECVNKGLVDGHINIKGKMQGKKPRKGSMEE